MELSKARVRIGFLLAGLAASILMGLGLLLVGETAARLTIRLVENRRPSSLLRAEAYAGVDWLPGYIDESATADRMEWYPWSYWRRLPFSGRYVNVDANQVRRTWRPDHGVGRRVRIFLLGGSTVWGTGARDDHTIPSYLAKGLAQRGLDPDIVNYGESGYVMAQDMAMLISRLEQGDVPQDRHERRRRVQRRSGSV